MKDYHIKTGGAGEGSHGRGRESSTHTSLVGPFVYSTLSGRLSVRFDS